MVYHFMFADTPTMDIEVDDKNKVIRYEKFLPDCPKIPFWGDNINTGRLYNFLKSRCYEDSRADLDDILSVHGMTQNNPYEWCRKTHGVTYEDFYWIKYDDEQIEWKDVKIR